MANLTQRNRLLQQTNESSTIEKEVDVTNEITESAEPVNENSKEL